MAPPRREPPWLVADIGGTNVRFGLAMPGTIAPLRLDSIYSYRVADFPSPAAAARAYLDVVAITPRHAVFGVAGTVRGGEAQLTNHGWFVSTEQLQQALQLESVLLVNDFAAMAMSLPLLGPGDLFPLTPVTRERSARNERQTLCVLGPGTGLGVSALVLQGGTVFGLHTEGGHVSFAPTSDAEVAIYHNLRERYGRVSLERLLSGTGMLNLYEAICAIDGVPHQSITPEELTALARSQADERCVRTAEMFCDMLGSVAGDFALAYGAWDGVYLAGGVLSALAPWVRQPRFRERFCDKGRFRPTLEAIPLGQIVHPQPGLLGATTYAVLGSGRTLFGE